MTQRVHATLGASTVLLVVTSLLSISHKEANSAPRMGGGHPQASPPIQDRMTLACKWEASTFMEATLDNIKSENDKGSGEVQFAVEDGQLTVKGKAGDTKLRLLGTVPLSEAMFFAEVTPAGHPILWSFYRLTDRRVLFVKQNNYAPRLTPIGGIYIYSHAGYCELSGGNGRAITK